MDHFNSYSSKTCVGNWWERRCDPQFDKANRVKTSRLLGPSDSRYATTYSSLGPRQDRSRFLKSTADWMHFQPRKDFETTTDAFLKAPQEQKPPFQLRQTALTKNAEALMDYRNRWTSGNHQFPRTYAGSVLQRVEHRT